MNRRRFLVAAIAMIVILVAGAPIAYVYLRGAGRIEATSLDDVLKGRAALEVEEGYEKSIFFREASIGTFNALAYSVFSEARTGALVGSDGWLFSREEFNRPKDVDRNIEGALAYVEAVARHLAATDTRLVVALIPLKADIYREHLGAHALPAVQDALYPAVRERLAAGGGIIVPDLRVALLAAKGATPVFLKTDTHWTVAGAAAAARAIAASVPGGLDLPAKAYTSEPEPAVGHSGDLQKFMDFGTYADRLALPPEEIRPVRAVEAEGDIDDLLGSSDASDAPNVVLVGTSYSANPLWSFETALKSSMATDLLNYAAEGEGPFKPMAGYLKAFDAAAKKPALVVWEVPVRYMLMDRMLP